MLRTYLPNRLRNPQNRAAKAQQTAGFWARLAFLGRAPTVGRAGVVFDLDGTLVDDAVLDWDLPQTELALALFDLAPLPLAEQALRWERTAGIDVAYVTGRDQLQWTATRLWLNKHKLFGALVCRYPHAPPDMGVYKGEAVRRLVTMHNWQHVLVYENNPANLASMLNLLPDEVGGAGHLAVEAAAGAPATDHQRLSDQDLVNLQLLGKRCCERGWEKLLTSNNWTSRSELLDAMQDWVPGRRKRRRFRAMIDDLWARGRG